MILLSLLILFSTQSRAAECKDIYEISPPPTPLTDTTRCKIENATLYIDGEINGDLEKSLRANPGITRIELNSAGGDTKSSYSAAALIRERGIATHVREGAICESACTLIYQGGKTRTAHPAAKFMVHGSRLGKEAMKSWLDFCEQKDIPARESIRRCGILLLKHFTLTREETDKFLAAHVEFGASQNLVDQFHKQPVDKDWFNQGNFSRRTDMRFTAAELLASKFNIVQALD